MMDLMVDIETLGNRPGSVILSIGAVWFDAATGEFGDEFYAAINPQSAISSGLKMDVSTVQWWMKQSDDARAAAFSGEKILGWALGEFGDFVRKSEAKRIWAKPPSFDLVLLEAAFAACSIQIPWEYWTPRDCRTLFEISKVKQAAFGTAHNALDDAKAQAAGVIEAYRVLGLSEPPPAVNVEPVAWLRPGEYVPIQNCPFGAMWISDKDDPRAFPVYAKPPRVAHQEPIGLRRSRSKGATLMTNPKNTAPAPNSRGSQLVETGFSLNHRNELSAGHGSGLSDADLANKSDEPSRSVELNSEVSGDDHSDAPVWHGEGTTAVSKDLLPNLAVNRGSLAPRAATNE